MQSTDKVRRWLVAATLSGGVLLLAASPAFASHEGTDYDPNDFCHFPDSGMADVEDGPVDEDTETFGWCVVSSHGGGGGDEFPDSDEDGVGDVGADADGIVPAARIDAGAGGAAVGGNPALLGGVLTGAAGAVGAVAARRRR